MYESLKSIIVVQVIDVGLQAEKLRSSMPRTVSLFFACVSGSGYVILSLQPSKHGRAAAKK